MKVYWYWLFVIGIATSVASGQQPGAIRDALRRVIQGDTADGVEVLTRGPVHEAYAGTVTFNPEEGLAVPSIPPAAIEEVPPDQRPEGADVSWIPGYWAWDDDRSDFLWVSGIWRRIPPGRQWLPGYWGRAPGGARWASGYWADAEATEVEYLPEPPESVEEGPSGEATSADHVWLPGLWLRQQDRYVWRPGYWAEGHADWQWIPSHYVWSPRGYVFVDGYYDYPEEQRGVLFAPVYFEPRVYTQPNFTYSPSVAISGSVFGRHLFVRPNYGHYYFGDYYGANYSNIGLSPWFSFQSSRSGYDPFYARQRWLNRQDRNWEQNIQRNYENRRDHEQSRPPRTWVEQRARVADANAAREADALIAESYEELATRRDRPLRVQRLENAERQQLMERQRGIRQLREQRQRMEIEEEREEREEPRIPREVRQGRVTLPASPITARRAERRDDGVGPPARAEAPQPDEKVEPRQRRTRRASEAPVEPRPTASGPRRERAASEPDRRSESPRETPQADRGREGRPPADGERPSADAKPTPSEPQEKPTAPQPLKEAPKTESPQSDPKPPKADPKPPEADPKPPEAEPKPPEADPKPPQKEPKEEPQG